MHNRSKLGYQAEKKVVQYLQQHGFTIVAHNYRLQGGEIDIIAMDKSVVAFVEVKMRQQDYFDLGAVITPSKQRKIIATAKNYIALHEHYDKAYRFDVALLQGTDDNLELIYIPNAFNEGGLTW
jgi:putative endonuclease